MIYFTIILVVLVVIWLLMSFINYRNAIRLIEDYIEKNNQLKEKELITNDMLERAEAFSERMKLKSRYAPLNESAEMYLLNEKQTKRKLLKEYFKYGFIYNFWRI